MRYFIGFLILLPSISRAEEPTADQLEFFEKKIRPVLVRECYQCHSNKAKSVKGGLLLDTREGIRRGGESGHAVVPGQLADSLLIEAIRYEGYEMPPKRQLPQHIIADFEKWVRMGAPDPREGKAAPIRRSINFEQAREFWSFQPIKDVAPPKVKNAATDIDRFVLRKLDAAGLKPSPRASESALIRRLYFDLIGLPPNPDQIAEYTNNPTRDNFAAIADRLLETDQFGERWGRHWLDVVRYAESTGMERNYTYPEAWRYRDYVISAFNADKPFDQFLTEQIAGDLIPHATEQQRDECVIATGMLAIGPKSLNERDKEKFAMDVVDEQIDVVSRAFLGLTASCARCHDHKFDPIPQTEYYRLAGIFRSSKTYFGTGGGNGNRQSGQLIALRGDEMVPVRIGKGKSKKNNAVRKINSQLKAQQKKLANLKKRQGSGTAKQIAATEKAIQRFRKQLANAKKQPTAGTAKDTDSLIMAVLDSNSPADTPLRIRGEANERGEIVPRGFLTIASLVDAPKVADNGSGRAELAQWLAQPENPLTARVIVNRIWQHLFGNGIVRTVNNFGANGDRPTHPELLDFLANKMQNNGWSIKSIIREVVASSAYQQSAQPNPNAVASDPANNLLWRMNPRRLEAEAIRDAVLAVSGQLDVSPAEKSVVHSVGNGDIGTRLSPQRFETSHTKRSVYLPIVRGVVPEMLRVFDFPEPSIIAGARDVTTVPGQALYMMNSPFIVEQSGELATRLLEHSEDNHERISYAYQLALGRAPSKPETQRVLNFIANTSSNKQTDASSKSAWTAFCQTLFASAEFRYTE